MSCKHTDCLPEKEHELMYLYQWSVVYFRLINWLEFCKETVNGISYNFSQEDGICCWKRSQTFFTVLLVCELATYSENLPSCLLEVKLPEGSRFLLGKVAMFSAFCPVSLLQHDWLGRYQALAELDDKLIIWIRYVGAGKWLKQAVQEVTGLENTQYIHDEKVRLLC